MWPRRVSGLDIRCICQHAPEGHRRGVERCEELDGYGVPCLCPSFELEDLLWDEPDPDDARERLVNELLRARP